MKALLLKADRSERMVEPINGRFDLNQIYSLIGCEVFQPIQLNDNRKVLLVDEDGKLKKLPINQRATKLFHQAGGAEFDFVVGDVLVVVNSGSQYVGYL